MMNNDQAIKRLAVSGMLTALAVALSGALYWKSKKKEALFAVPCVIMATIYLFAPKMHERYLFPALFFLLVLFAALTSSVSVMEAIVSVLMEKFGIGRKAACTGTLIFALLAGIPVSLGNGIWSGIKILGMDLLTFFDYLSNSVMMPLVALFTCIMVGWFIGTKTITDEVTRNGEKFGRKRIYEVMIKYIAPVFLLIILISYNLSQFGIITL